MTTDKSSISAMQQRFHAIQAEPAPPDPPISAPSFETTLLESLRRPVPPGQARDGHAQKEHELGELFARLAIPDAMTLQKRLTRATSDDPLAIAFARLLEERRARLLRFLGDARRRAAMK